MAAGTLILANIANGGAVSSIGQSSGAAANFATAGLAAVPKTKVDFGTRSVSGDLVGNVMTADPLSIDPGSLAGSAPHQQTKLWVAVNQRPYEYIRGHLLNHHVHGPGENRNLVPITGSCNTTMEKQAEHVIKKAVIGEGKVVRFIAKAKGKQGVRKHIPQESELPEKMVLHAVELEEGGDGKWKTEGNVLLNNKEIPNTLPSDVPIGTVHVEVNLSTARRAQLDLIEGVGPVLADRIVKLRNKLGRPFHTYDDLTGAEGIGDDTVEKLKNNKWVKLY